MIAPLIPATGQRRLGVLKAGNFLCAIAHPTKCKRRATIMDHKLGLKIRDLIPAAIRPTLDEMNTGAWNLQPACVDSSRWKTSMEGHYVQGHNVDWQPDFSIIPDHIRNRAGSSSAPDSTPRSIMLGYTESGASSTSDAGSDASSTDGTGESFESWDPRSQW